MGEPHRTNGHASLQTVGGNHTAFPIHSIPQTQHPQFILLFLKRPDFISKNLPIHSPQLHSGILLSSQNDPFTHLPLPEVLPPPITLHT